MTPVPVRGAFESCGASGARLGFVDHAAGVCQRATPARGCPAVTRKPWRLQVSAQEAKEQVTDKGWFFNNFVKDRYYVTRRANMLAESAARQGKIDTLFDSAFKYTAWLEVHRALTEAKQQSLSPQEALSMVNSPWSKAVLLDIREAQDFEKTSAEGAVNAPLFRLIQGSDLKANMRRLGYALLTDFAGTERNPEFISAALQAVGGNKRRPVIVMCGRGGSLDSSVERKGKKFTPPERLFGTQSRSLKACYELRQAGFTNVYHLKGGLNQWFYDGLP